MEGLLTNNIFFVYLLGVLVIINYEAFEKKQKIAIIYACSFGLTFNGELHCIIILALLLFVLFLYEEYLNEDLVKIKYVKRLRYKFLDFIYMYMFQYKLFYIVFAIFLKEGAHSAFLKALLRKSQILSSSLENVIFFASIVLIIIGIHNMFINSVELKNFKQINQKFSEYPYYLLPLREKEKRKKLFEKLELVTDIEDYTFFIRKNSYSSFSLEFIWAVCRKKRGNKIRTEIAQSCWIHRMWQNILLFIKIKRKIKVDFMKERIMRYFRGYSTIEMQLMRILAYKKGLKMGKPKNLTDAWLIFQRKVFEIIYTPMFLKGLKEYLMISQENDFFRYYLVYIYLHTVQTNLNGRTFAPLDKVFGKVDVIDWPKEALFIITLGLNNLRITKDRVSLYKNVISKYQLNEELIYQLIDCIPYNNG